MRVKTLSTLPLSALARRIVELGCRKALEEIHARKAFVVRGGEWICFGAYAEELRQWAYESGRWRHRGGEVIDRAIEILMERFASLPPREKEDMTHGPGGNGKPKKKPRIRKTNCCTYFAVYLRCVEASFQRTPPKDEIQQERLEAALLQAFVLHQLDFCFREALRESIPGQSRYCWKVGARRVTVRFPKWVKGRRRRAWLEEHIGEEHRSNLSDQELQNRIDAYFGHSGVQSLDEFPVAAQTPSRLPSPRFLVEMAEARAMRTLIADEKAARVKSLRPAIQKLGEENVRALSHAILLNLEQYAYSDRELAQQYGLSTPTYSRFAGTSGREEEGPHKMPDFFQNVARTLMSCPDFVDTAREMGLLSRMEAAAGVNEEETSHGA